MKISDDIHNYYEKLVMQYFALSKFDEKQNNILLEEDSIVIAKSVSTSDLFQFRKYNIAGFVTEEGGLTSHSAILARSFEITSVIGAKKICHIAYPNNEIIINGFNGDIILSPNIYTKRQALAKINSIKEHKEKLGKLVDVDTRTLDNKKIKISGNVNIIEDLSKALNKRILPFSSKIMELLSHQS